MADSFERLRELNLSRDEVERIGEALKKPEFRRLLSEYVEELQDPKNRKLYQEEVASLERQRGVEVTFVEPKPGYVIKTSVDGGQKGFVNVCSSEHVGRPSSAPAVREGTRGLSWSLPHSLSHPRDDVDNRGSRCRVFDVVFHPDTLHLADKNRTFRSMVNDTALEAVESNFDVRLDKKNLKFPKLAYKGMPHVSVIRTPAETKPEHTPEEKEFYDKIFAQADAQAERNKPKKPKQTKKDVKNVADDRSEYTTPKYEIKHRSHIDMQEFTEHKQAKINAAIPKELVIEISLPLLKSSSDITLDVDEKLLRLTSEKPAKYKLNLTLPYSINESLGNAKFEKDLKKLVVTLPVKKTASIDIDSGVESDHPASPQSEEEFVVTSENSKNLSDTSTQFRTKTFLNKDLHYSLPEFTCHVYENTIAFTLNVKNVEEGSVDKMFCDPSIIHVKFTNIGSSFYPCHYAFCVKLASRTILAEDSTVEVWDNNVVIQVPVEGDVAITSYFYGINEEELMKKFVETPEVLNQMLEEVSEVPLEKQPKRDEPIDNEPEPISDSFEPQPDFGDMAGTSYESSGDELSCGSSFSPRKGKGILKRFSSMRQAGRSISESSLDDFMCTSSYENAHSMDRLDSVIPEDGEVSTSLKKTVRFNNNVMKQLFRSNSSILGQKKKNQRKAQKKKRAMERRYSESEVSEGDEKKERDLNDWKKDELKDQGVNKKEDHEIFHLDIDN